MVLSHDCKVLSIWKNTLCSRDRLLCLRGWGPSRRTVGPWVVSGSLQSLHCYREASAMRRPHSHTCILQASIWGYSWIEVSISPTSCSDPWPLLSFSMGTSHPGWPGHGFVPTGSRIACSGRLRCSVNLGDQLLEAVVTQASRPLHPSVAWCHVTPQLGFLGCTSSLSAGFNFHFLS